MGGGGGGGGGVVGIDKWDRECNEGSGRFCRHRCLCCENLRFDVLFCFVCFCQKLVENTPPRTPVTIILKAISATYLEIT